MYWFMVFKIYFFPIFTYDSVMNRLTLRIGSKEEIQKELLNIKIDKGQNQENGQNLQ